MEKSGRTENGLIIKKLLSPRQSKPVPDQKNAEREDKKRETATQARPVNACRNDTQESEVSTGISPQSEEEMRMALKRRNRLEGSILSLIGGKTGMSMTWGEIIQCASRGDDLGFLFLATSFPRKAEILKNYFDELMNIISNTEYRKVSKENELARRLSLPYLYEEECRKLLCNCTCLVESGLTERQEISKEELRMWHSRLVSQTSFDNEPVAKEEHAETNKE